jgi:hypothetical protein
VIIGETHVEQATKFLKNNFKRLKLAEYVKEIEGECFSQDFLEIFGAIDEVGIQILIQLLKNKTSIRKLATALQVNKSTIESRIAILKQFNIVDTSSHTKLTSFGIKILKSILKFNQEYEDNMSVDPKKPDINQEVSLKPQTVDTRQLAITANREEYVNQTKIEEGDSH